ncbi:MAG: hypothetical protein FJ179_07450 [Gammaproteobacteria bacterium]|nr:hypothetical protein [Gammaproteobacteria bacterium]
MNDFALGIVIFTIAAVPASLLLLALADVIRLEGEGQRRRWIRNCLWALAVPASVPLAAAVWGWAGAAHLEPLCHAYATPDYRSAQKTDAPLILLDSKDGSPQPWLAALQTRFPDRLITDAANAVAGAATHVLEVRRVTHHRNLWFDVQMERFRVIDRHWGAVVAEADELWVDAGRARYHCGVVSGPAVVPSERSLWPGGDGIARFVARSLAPSPALKP